MFLLCRPDLKWIDDPVRENQGHKREKLFRMYEEELVKFDLPYAVIDGEGDTRLSRAVQNIERLILSETK